jgi:hypothetical protein
MRSNCFANNDHSPPLVDMEDKYGFKGLGTQPTKLDGIV